MLSPLYSYSGWRSIAVDEVYVKVLRLNDDKINQFKDEFVCGAERRQAPFDV